MLMSKKQFKKGFKKNIPNTVFGVLIHSCKTKGGARKGAGRPKLKKSQKKEPTKVVRVPLSKLSAVMKIIKGN